MHFSRRLIIPANVARLASGDATVMELAVPFRMTQPAISQHLKVLQSAGLVIRRIEGKSVIVQAFVVLLKNRT
jgi:DNA-binding transcriptional ArsR family regulator